MGAGTTFGNCQQEAKRGKHMNVHKVHFFRLSLLTLLVGVPLAACGTGDSRVAELMSDHHGMESMSQDLVKVAREGSRFDPAVTVSQIPDGAWMCDMNGVHYAALDQGDGKCPVCGMKLKKRSQQGDESGHEHDHQ